MVVLMVVLLGVAKELKLDSMKEIVMATHSEDM